MMQLRVVPLYEQKSEVAEIEELERTGVSDSSVARVLAILEHATRGLIEEFAQLISQSHGTVQRCCGTQPAVQ